VLNSEDNSTNPEDVYKSQDGIKTEESLAVANNAENGNYVTWSKKIIIVCFVENTA
jgi:hypothetical protein